MQMKATSAATLSALAQIDNGTLALVLDEQIYPERAVRAFVETTNEHYRATCTRIDGRLHLEIRAADPMAARLQVGEALTDLLVCAMRQQS